WNRRVLSGLYRTTLELVPLLVNGAFGAGVRTPLASTVQPSAIGVVAVASPAYRRSALQLKSSAETLPVPSFANGDPATGVNTPALMVYMETLVVLETARKRPSGDMVMLELGEQQFVVLLTKASAPLAATLNVLICPLLAAIRNAPSGVTARD